MHVRTPLYFINGTSRLNFLHTKLKHNSTEFVKSPNWSTEDLYHFFFVYINHTSDGSELVGSWSLIYLL